MPNSQEKQVISSLDLQNCQTLEKCKELFKKKVEEEKVEKEKNNLLNNQNTLVIDPNADLKKELLVLDKEQTRFVAYLMAFFIKYHSCGPDHFCKRFSVNKLVTFLMKNTSNCLKQQQSEDCKKKCLSDIREILKNFKVNSYVKLNDYFSDLNQDLVDKFQIRNFIENDDSFLYQNNHDYQALSNKIDEIIKNDKVCEFIFEHTNKLFPNQDMNKLSNSTNKSNLTLNQNYNESFTGRQLPNSSLANSSFNIGLENRQRQQEIDQPFYTIFSIFFLGLFLLLFYPIYRPLINSLRDLICEKKNTAPNSRITKSSNFNKEEDYSPYPYNYSAINQPEQSYP